MDPRIGKSVLPLARQGPGGTLAPLGTCFSVAGRKLATAAHVVGPSDQGLVAIIGRVNSLNDYQDTSNTTVHFAPVKIVNYSPFYDITILEFDDLEFITEQSYALGSADDIGPGMPVVSLGYPHANHGRLVLTQQSSVVGARILLSAEGLKVKHVVLNTQTRPGQSGGPVFSADGKKVCAMVLGGYTPAGADGLISLGGIDPQTLHQTTHAVSAEYISGLL